MAEFRCHGVASGISPIPSACGRAELTVSEKRKALDRNDPRVGQAKSEVIDMEAAFAKQPLIIQ